MPIPKQIGPYKILKELGSGGMGVVYRAVHTDLKRDVALKVLTPNSARNEVLLKRFLLEARAAAMPYHENLVLFYEHGQADGYHYMALEYVRGKDLGYILRKHGQLPVSFTVHVIKQAARALDHAYKNGYVHRDIKPSNLLITKDKLVKLTDMGLARQLEELEDNKVTRDGTTVGTVDYMAPEQAQDSRAVDIRGDIYALGCTWFHMLAGQVPYRGGTALERLYKHASDPIPDVRDLNPKVPESVAFTIEKMMAKSPEHRFQTPTELIEELEHLDLSRTSTASLADLIAEEEEEEEPPPTPRPLPKAPLASPRITAPPVDPTLVPQYKRGLNPLWVLSGLAIVGVLAGIATLVALSNRQAPAPVVEEGSSIRNDAPASPETATLAKSVRVGAADGGSKAAENPKPAKGEAPKVRSGEIRDRGQILPLNKAQQQEIYGDWQTIRPMEAQKRFPVRRLESPAAEGNVAVSSDLGQAWRLAAKELVGQDSNLVVGLTIGTQGPLFFSSQQFTGERPLVVEPEPGFAPLVVLEWMKSGTSANPEWFSFRNGRVDIRGVHFVVLADDLPVQNVPFTLFSLHDAELSLRKCTVTVLGKHHAGVNVVALQAGSSDRPKRILIEDCVFRGENLSAVRLTRSADVLIENSCLVSSAQSLVWISQSDRSEQGIDVRLANSTLICGREGVHCEWKNASQSPVRVSMSASVFAAASSNKQHPLLLVDGAGDKLTQLVSWRAVRSVYLDWPKLAAQSAKDGAAALAEDLNAWKRLWLRNTNLETFRPGGVQLADGFMLDGYPDVYVGEATFPDHPTVNTFVGYDLGRCLPLSPHWFEHAYGEFPIDGWSAGASPESESGAQVDVAISHPRSIAQALDTHRSVKNLTLVLSGTGAQTVDPVEISDRSVTLKFAKRDPPLVVQPPNDATQPLFSVTNGRLVVQDGRFEWNENGAGLVLLRGSELVLDRCLASVPFNAESKAQVLLRGEAEDPNRVTLRDVCLASPNSLIAFQTPHFSLTADNCILISNQDAVVVNFEHAPKDWKSAAVLNRCSVSVAGAAVRLGDYPQNGASPAVPMVIQATDCLFTDLLDGGRGRFAQRPRSGGVLAAGSRILDKQVVAWQGSHNGFDNRLARFVAAPGSSQMNFTKASIEWFRVWGIRHEAYPLLSNFFFEEDLESARLKLKGLLLRADDPGTIAASDGGRIGADLRAFGIAPPKTTRSAPPAYEYTAKPLSKTFVLGTGNAPVLVTPTSDKGKLHTPSPPAPRGRQSRSDRKTPVRSVD